MILLAFFVSLSLSLSLSLALSLFFLYLFSLPFFLHFSATLSPSIFLSSLSLL